MLKKSLSVLLISMLINFFAGISAHAQQNIMPLPFPMPFNTFAMQQSMDPNVYGQMMQLMSQPNTFNNPALLCAQCHDGADMERYQATLLPVMQMVMNPANWFNPNTYTQTMMPQMIQMMDPQTYNQWYQAWMKKMNAPIYPNSE